MAVAFFLGYERGGRAEIELPVCRVCLSLGGSCHREVLSLICPADGSELAPFSSADSRNVHDGRRRLPGLRRAVPSAPLDELSVCCGHATACARDPTT